MSEKQKPFSLSKERTAEILEQDRDNAFNRRADEAMSMVNANAKEAHITATTIEVHQVDADPAHINVRKYPTKRLLAAGLAVGALLVPSDNFVSNNLGPVMHDVITHDGASLERNSAVSDQVSQEVLVESGRAAGTQSR
jgi:hypothetical protein